MTQPPTRLRRYWNALMRVYNRADTADLGLVAAGIAFWGFLGIFPALAAIIAIWGFAADPIAIRAELALLQDFLPADSYTLIYDQVEALLRANSRDLGWATAISLSLALWSARTATAALIQGINAIYHLPNRSGPRHILRAIALTMTLVGVVLSAMLLAVAAPIVIGFLPLDRGQAQLLEAANMAVGLMLVVFAIMLVYRLGPNRPKSVRKPLFTRGLLLAVILWAVVSRGLVIYFTNFTNYNEVYGSIGAVVALLMWLYLSCYAVLLGAAVDAERAARRQ